MQEEHILYTLPLIVLTSIVKELTITDRLSVTLISHFMRNFIFSLEASDIWGEKDLKRLCHLGRTSLVDRILDRCQRLKYDIAKLINNETGTAKTSMLATVVERGHIELFRLLVARGGNPKQPYFSNNFLYLAADKKQLPMMKILVEE